jgi:hypothetical protein
VLISNSRCQPSSCSGSKVLLTKLGRVRANANGVAIDRVTIPKKFALGSKHTVEARGVSDHGRALTESTTVTIYQSVGISVKPASPAPGASAVVTAAGFKPGGSVTVLISDSRCQPSSCSNSKVLLTKLGRVHANANGVAIDRVTIPKKFALGSKHTVEARGVSDQGRALTEFTTVTLSRHRS